MGINVTKNTIKILEQERARLVRIFNAAFDALADNPHLACKLFTSLLVDEHTLNVFSRRDIANIFYNRSLSYRDMASSYAIEGEYRSAHSMMRKALSDSHNAELRYERAEDLKVCHKRQDEYERQRQAIIRQREAAECASDNIDACRL